MQPQGAGNSKSEVRTTRSSFINDRNPVHYMRGHETTATRQHPPSRVDPTGPYRFRPKTSPNPPPRNRARLCQLVSRCARLCHIVNEPIAHSIAHSHAATLKTAPRPHETALNVVGPTGLEPVTKCV